MQLSQRKQREWRWSLFSENLCERDLQCDQQYRSQNQKKNDILKYMHAKIWTTLDTR